MLRPRIPEKEVKGLLARKKRDSENNKKDLVRG
jgi:hypothetical protein